MTDNKLLFAGPCYYPRGGINDLVFCGTEAECMVFFASNARDIGKGDIDNWGHIVDRATLKKEKWGQISDYWVNGEMMSGEPKWYDYDPDSE